MPSSSDRIRQPRQGRSQETMIRILDAFEKLLRQRAYATIKISDIATESSTGAGSIYARFDGKRSILLAVHARLRERVRQYYRSLFDPMTAAGEGIEGAVERITRGMLAWHKQNEAIIKTSLILDDPDIYQGISTSFRPYSAQLSLLLRARKPSLSEHEAMTAAIAIHQITIATLQQRAIFGGISPIGHELTDHDLVEVIVAAALGQLDRKN